MDGMVSMTGPAKKVKNGCPFENLRLTPADNGHKVTYYEKGSNMGGGSYDHVEMKHKEFVYEAKDLDKAVAKYKEVSDCMLEYTM